MYSEEETGRVRRVGDITERATRQSENLNIEYKKTTAVQKSIMYDGIKMYNRVPNYMTNIKDLKQFKGEVRHWILNKNDIQRDEIGNGCEKEKEMIMLKKNVGLCNKLILYAP